MNSSLKQILVHVDGSTHGAQRLQLASELAHAHGAALSVLYAAVPSFMALAAAPEMGPTVAANLAQIDEQRRARTRALFDTLVAGTGPGATWSETDEFPIAGVFAAQALYSDLVVLGQRDPSQVDPSDVPPDFVESVLAVSGKAALVIPYIGAPAGLGDTVAIAWKETREAALAVHAALPLLQRARRVHIMSWGASPPAVKGTRLDLPGYLRQHGVQAEWHQDNEEPTGLGELLLSRAFDLQASLLVMGCYGHSRAREWILGGTTRSILRAMTLPVLMAH